MTDFLNALIARNTPQAAEQPGAVRPRPRALFEPTPESSADSSPLLSSAGEEPAAPPALERMENTQPNRTRPIPHPAQTLNAPGGQASPPPGAAFAGSPTAQRQQAARPPAGTVLPAPPQPNVPTRGAASQATPASEQPEPVQPRSRSTAGEPRPAVSAPIPSAPAASEQRTHPTIVPPAAAPARPAPAANRPASSPALPNAEHPAREEGSRSAANGPPQDPGRTVRVQPGQSALPSAPARPAPARDAAQPQGAAQPQEPEPVIHISIGRIEVRAAPPPPAQSAARARQPAPPVSLEDYLRRNSGGKR